MDNSNSVSVSRSVRQNDYSSGMDFDSGNLYSSYNSGLSFMYNDPRISRPLNREENHIIFREKSKKDENVNDNNMSILIAEIVEDHIFMMADSRSSKTEGGQYTYKTYVDTYEKIVYLRELDFLIGSTGLNEFDGLTLNEVINEVWEKEKHIILSGKTKNNKTETFINLLNQRIEKSVKTANCAVILVYGYYWHEDDKEEPHIGVFEIRPNGKIYNDKVGRNTLYSFGDDFTVKMLERVYAPVPKDVRSHFYHYKDALETIINLESNYFINSVIGGRIKTCVIDKNGEAKI